MASFQPKTSQEMLRNIENKNYRSDQFLPDPLQRIPKKLQKLKNTILATFEAKIGWERPKKRENKNYRFDQFQSNLLQRIPKKQQKNSKN